MATRTLLTAALPYANGSIHVGHLVEYTLADIHARFLRSRGDDIIFLCADDTHGTPIELNAARQGITPEALIARSAEEHQADFRDFDISFDAYGSTHSDDNRRWAERVYGALKDAGEIDRRDVEQTYCEHDQRFLPDRFVRGTCPHCGSGDQYGDACEKCGKTYEPTELKEPRCALCGRPPVRRSSTHLFFRLSRHAAMLEKLVRDPKFLHAGVGAHLAQWFEKGLSDWDISRDGPYFGFPIPGETDKYFYVWLDAPIGYIAATELYARTTGKVKDALTYWAADADSRIEHVIGKDIVYFHALFWPAVLKTAGLKQPDRLIVHGHLTVNGEKMSKSRGTMISARRYLDVLDPSYLRYFFAANLSATPEDIDLSLEDFRLRVNGELVNNLGNLANRALSMLASRFERRLAPVRPGPGQELVASALRQVPAVRAAYEKLDLRQVVRLITAIGAEANAFLQTQAPWAKLKTDAEAAHADLSDAADVVYILAALLEPIVPGLSTKLFSQLDAPRLTFEQLAEASPRLLDRTATIGTPAPLIARLEAGVLDGLVAPEAPAEVTAPKTQAAPAQAKAKSPKSKEPKAPAGPPAEIDFGDFLKVDLRVGRIVTAERVPKADKLLKLSVDLGEETPRTIASGIAEAYAPEGLVGRHVVVVTNLAPRTIRGIESRGMLLCAGPGGADLKLVDPGELPPGSEVK
ncbi:MAG TPA: methionine--tRNA ligase [Myxococcaceae bacterium]|nr:methionine--tRNA ligase [Myxococcaceae bacterium]